MSVCIKGATFLLPGYGYSPGLRGILLYLETLNAQAFFGVFLCHVLEPGQTQIRRCLVTLGNSEDGFRKFQIQLVSDIVFLLGMDTFFPLRVLPACSENKRKGKHVSVQLFLFHV